MPDVTLHGRLESPPPSELPPQPSWWENLRARVMFALAFGYLLLVAGLIHRAGSKEVTQFELDVLTIGISLMWPVFVAEAIWGVTQRDRSQPGRAVYWRAVLVILMPPWRMALTDPRTGLIWIPRIGWQSPGKDLFKRLELVFSGPMLLFAFLILPVLGLEYVNAEQVRRNPVLALIADIGIAVIWVAFATEFILKASAHPKPLRFAKERWLDVAIVVLPMLEYFLTRWVDAAPLARLLRLGRAISPEQLARMQRLYRLQGLATKAWHALLLLEGVARLFGQTHEKRLARLEAMIAEAEEELAELRRDADELRRRIAERLAEADRFAVAQKQPEVVSGGASGTPAGEAVMATNRPSAP
jgi:voltage-gated potassium channel